MLRENADPGGALRPAQGFAYNHAGDIYFLFK